MSYFAEPYSRANHTAIALSDTLKIPFAHILIVVIHPPSMREWPSFFARHCGSGPIAVTRAEAAKSTYDVVAMVDAKCRLTLESDLAKSLSSTPPDESSAPNLF